MKICGNEKNLAVGCGNGMVKLYDEELSLLKKFPQITTRITAMSMNEKYLSFSTKWK